MLWLFNPDLSRDDEATTLAVVYCAPDEVTAINLNKAVLAVSATAAALKQGQQVHSGQRQAALVTGGGTRLGAHFARFLAASGYDIALHYNSSAEGALAVAAEIKAQGGRCEVFQHDFLASTTPAALIDEVYARFTNLSVLVNSASVYDASSTQQSDLALLEKQFKVNMFTPYLLTARFAALVESGAVVNIIDNKIAYQQYYYSAYLLSKKSLADFTRMAALEFAPKLRINGIAPGVVLPMDARTSDYIEWRIDGIPLKQQGSPDHLCQALAYLLNNSFVTGQILFVDGGEGLNHIGRNAESYTDAR